MKNPVVQVVGMAAIALAGAMATVGCGPKSGTETPNTPGVAEKTGAALDRAAAKTKDVAGQAIEKTGEALEKAGAAVERTGEGMQK